MRASETEQTAGAGVSEVSANLERIGWGPVRNDAHDLGTDLLVQVRDERLFDRGLVLGVQVKAGSSYFDRPNVVDDEVTGWWYVERGAEHFDDWVTHALPHLLVLHDLDDRVSYWVHVTPASVVSTGVGCKVCVPSSQTIDDANLPALLRVAGTAVAQRTIERTAVAASSQNLPPNRRLRHALLAPRLVTPHRNRGFSLPIAAPEAVALVAEGRFADWGFFAKEHAEVPDPEEALSSADWEWAFAAGFWAWFVNGDVDGLISSVDTARVGRERAASVATLACAAQRDGSLREADAILSRDLAQDDLSPADQGWLLVQRARIRGELGDLAGCRTDASSAQLALRADDGDLTVSALASAASWLLYTSVDFGDGDLESHLTISDTAVSWWREGRISGSLRDEFDDRFKAWAALPRPVLAWRRETVDDQLLAAELSADLTGEHGAWRSISSLVWQQRLQNCPDDDQLNDHYVQALEALRRAGDKNAISAVSNRILQWGPSEAAVSVVNEVRTGSLTRSNADATFELLVRLGEFADEGTAGQLVEELLDLLDGRPPAAIQTSGVDLERRVLDAVAGLLHASPPDAHRRVGSYLSGLDAPLRPILSTAVAHVFGALDGSVLADDTRTALWSAATDDASADAAAVLGCLLRSDHPLAQQELVTRSAAGDLEALQALRYYDLLSEDAIGELIPRLVAMVDEKTADASAGRYQHGHDVVYDLAAVNLRSSAQANWTPVIELLLHPKVSAADKRGVCDVLIHRYSDLPTDVSGRLVANRARVRVAQVGGFHGDIGAVDSLLAVAAGLFTQEEIEAEVVRLSSGTPEDRRSVLRLLSSGHLPHLQPILAAYLVDPDPSVRHAAASVVGQMSGRDPDSAVTEMARRLTEDSGVAMPLSFLGSLREAGTSSLRTECASRLTHHPSARVRLAARRTIVPPQSTPA